jgi:ADP-heptose:LPS heptosyltransferase
VITAGPSDAAAAIEARDAARRLLPPLDRRAILEGPDWDLPELRAVIGRAALFIGGDSGPLHVAATTTTPIVGLYGPTLAARSRPWRASDLVTESIEPGPLPCRPCEQRRCEPGDFRCLTGLSPDAALDAARRALARASATAPARSHALPA